MKRMALCLICFLILVLSSSYQICARADLYENRSVGKGVIRGTVTNEDGDPLFFVRIYAIGEKTNGNRLFGFTFTHLLIGGKGSYELKVDPGRYLIIRAGKLPMYLGAHAGPIVVEAGDTVTIDLSVTSISSLLKPKISLVEKSTSNHKFCSVTGIINGTITNKSGSPLENAHLVAFTTLLSVLKGNRPVYASAATSSDGSYIMYVPQGQYFVVAGKVGHGFAIATPVIVDQNISTTVDLSLSGGLLKPK